MVPGSTLMYGSSLMLVTRMPRDSRIAARDAAAIPLPREETTPPVTNTYLAIYPARVGMEEFTGVGRLPQILFGARSADGAFVVLHTADAAALHGLFRAVHLLRQVDARALVLRHQHRHHVLARHEAEVADAELRRAG